MNSIPLKDFSGGITENYLSGDPTKAKTMENLLVTSNRKIHSRDGSVINDGTYYQITDGAVRVGSLIPYDKTDTYFWQYARKLYYVNAGFVNLTGPSANQAFDQAATTNYVRFAEWKKTLYAVCDAGSTAVDCFPIKIYRDGSSVLQLRTAGLPYFPATVNFTPATELAALCALADNLRTKMQTHFAADEAAIFAYLNGARTAINAHFADGLEHTTGLQTAIPNTPAINLATAYALARGIVTAWNIHAADASLAGGRAYHPAQVATASVVINVPGKQYPIGLADSAYFVALVKAVYNPHDSNTTAHGTNEGTHQFTTTAPVPTHNQVDSGAAALITVSTPATLPELLVLTGQLLKAYDFHFGDSKKAYPTYHTLAPGENVTLAGNDYTDDDPEQTNSALLSTDVPTTLLEAQASLWDLYVRYHVHSTRYAGHTYAVTGTIPTVDPRETVNYGPHITFDLTPLYASANELKYKLDAHRFREGAANEPHENYSPAANATPAASTPATLATLVSAMRQYYGEHVLGSEAQYHFGSASDLPDADEPIDPWTLTAGEIHNSVGGAPSYFYEQQITYLDDLVTKYNTHILRSVPHNADLSDAVADTVRSLVPGVATYIWAFHYEYTYTVGSVTYIDQGPIQYMQPRLSYAVEDYPAAIASIPVFTNSSKQNYDTASMKVKIARTEDGGSVLYYCGEVVNGTTTFTDAMPDARLVLQPLLYTEGGVPQNDPPPMAKHLAIIDGTAYYGNVVLEATVDGVTTKSAYPYRLMQSVPGDPDSVPVDNTLDFDDEIFLVAAARSKPLIGTRTKLYTVEGSFDLQGRGAMVPVRIDGVGTECPQSAVESDDGTYFFGVDGIYFTDGFKAVRLTTDWPVLYKTLISTATKRNRIQGVYDPILKRVIWTVQYTTSNSENDAFLILDLQFGLSASPCFSFWVNGDDFRPTALLMWNGQLLRADSRGYVFKHDSTYTSDPKINTSANPSTWAKKAVTYNWISTAQDFGNAKIRKFIPSMELFAKNLGNLSLQINRYNDDKSSAKVLTPIRYRTQYTGVIREERMMPAGGLRCDFMQLQLTNAIVIITNSDTLGAASFNKAAHTVTLDSAVTEDWPADAVDWYIYSDYKNLGAGNVADAYTTGYLVTVRTADTLTFTDPGNTAPSGSVKWVLKGVPKDETFEILSININAKTEDGDQQVAYQTSGTGANA